MTSREMPHERAIGELLCAIQALLQHPHLPLPTARHLRDTALSLVTVLTLPPGDPRLAVRLDRCEEALAACGVQLGLVPRLTDALAALLRVRNGLAAEAVRPARIEVAPRTRDPVGREGEREPDPCRPPRPEPARSARAAP